MKHLLTTMLVAALSATTIAATADARPRSSIDARERMTTRQLNSQQLASAGVGSPTQPGTAMTGNPTLSSTGELAMTPAPDAAATPMSPATEATPPTDAAAPVPATPPR